MPYPTIPVAEGDIIEARIEATLDGQQLITVFHYIVSATPGGSWDDSVWGNLLAQFDVEVSQPVAFAQSEEVINRYNVLQKIENDRYIAVRVLSEEQSGGQLGQSTPSGVALVVRRKGIAAARSSFGRIYVGGIPADSVDGSRAEDAYLAAVGPGLVAAVTAEVSDGNGRTLTPVLYNPSAEFPATTFVAYAEVDPVLRYQRRRELGVGS